MYLTELSVLTRQLIKSNKNTCTWLRLGNFRRRFIAPGAWKTKHPKSLRRNIGCALFQRRITSLLYAHAERAAAAETWTIAHRPMKYSIERRLTLTFDHMLMVVNSKVRAWQQSLFASCCCWDFSLDLRAAAWPLLCNRAAKKRRALRSSASFSLVFSFSPPPVVGWSL